MTTPHQRVLGRIRLSKDADEAGTSVERQTEAIEQWAAMHGHLIIGWAIDSGVSGSVDPFDTPILGEWLRAKHAEWDILVAYRLDRFSRSTITMNKLFGWALDHNKTVASCTEGIDISTGVGRLIAYVIAFLAEGELDAIRERNRGSQKTLRQLGRWHGGTTPYGYQAVQRQDGWYLTPYEPEVRVLRDEILPRVLGRRSINSITQGLNEAGIPSKRGGEWSRKIVRSILMSRALLGQLEHQGRVVTDEDGMPVQRAEPILTLEEFQRVAACLKAKSIRSGPRERSPMAGVLFCFDCEAPLHPQKMAGRSYSYYRCGKDCGARQIRADDADAAVEDRLMFEIGDQERTERVYRPGNDHTDELAAVREAIAATRREKDLGLYDGDDEGYFNRLERLVGKRRELEQLPSSPGGFEDVGTGETYAQAWGRLDAEGRRTMLLDSKIRIGIAVREGKDHRVRLYTPGPVPPETQKSPPGSL